MAENTRSEKKKYKSWYLSDFRTSGLELYGEILSLTPKEKDQNVYHSLTLRIADDKPKRNIEGFRYHHSNAQ